MPAWWKFLFPSKHGSAWNTIRKWKVGKVRTEMGIVAITSYIRNSLEIWGQRKSFCKELDSVSAQPRKDQSY